MREEGQPTERGEMDGEAKGWMGVFMWGAGHVSAVLSGWSG